MELRCPVVLITDLDLLRQIMVKDFVHFANRRTLGRKDDPTLINKMLFATTDQDWKNLRAAMTPAFTTGKIRHMFGVFNESSRKLTEFLNTETRGQCKEFDMKEVLGRYTMDVIASAAFGIDSQNFKNKNSVFAQMRTRFQNHFTGFLGTVRSFSSAVAPGIYRLLRFKCLDETATEFFTDVVLKTIKHRETTGEKRNDFLQLIIEAKNGNLKVEENVTTMDAHENEAPEKGRPVSKVTWTDELITAQCVGFLLAGFDSNESMFVFAAYEMALNPDIQNRLYEEIEGAVQKHGTLNLDVVNQLEYLDMFVSGEKMGLPNFPPQIIHKLNFHLFHFVTEILRKYPPIPRTERLCTKDYKVPDTKFEIKKGTPVVIPIWSIHHDPELYPDPDKFIPERFTADEKNRRHPFAYQPFGLGPRNCIGMLCLN